MQPGHLLHIFQRGHVIRDKFAIAETLALITISDGQEESLQITIFHGTVGPIAVGIGRASAHDVVQGRVMISAPATDDVNWLPLPRECFSEQLRHRIGQMRHSCG